MNTDEGVKPVLLAKRKTKPLLAQWNISATRNISREKRNAPRIKPIKATQAYCRARSTWSYVSAKSTFLDFRRNTTREITPHSTGSTIAVDNMTEGPFRTRYPINCAITMTAAAVRNPGRKARTFLIASR